MYCASDGFYPISGSYREAFGGDVDWGDARGRLRFLAQLEVAFVLNTRLQQDGVARHGAVDRGLQACHW
jgi:hypothetical protein